MTLPLQNVRVLDFGQYVAGPATAAMLGDQGAEVIRIDPPGGPRWQSPAMDTLNRRKKSIVLDLKKSQDLTIAHQLIATADVLIENFRPGVMTKLKLGPEAAHAINPQLVYVSLPGFAAEDKERAHLQAWEGIISAASGQFTDMGLNRILMGINPSFSPLTLASGYASVLGATSVSAALYARETTGQGDYIEVPIASVLSEGLVYNSMNIEDCPRRYLSLREHEIARRQKAGEPFNMTYDQLQAFMDPFYKSYFCADGRPVYVVCSCHVDHSHKALKTMDLLDEVLDAGLPELDDWYASSSTWPKGVDCALGLYPMSKKWADYVSELMKKRFLEKTSFAWEKIFAETNVPVTAHRTTEEWLNSEHALASGLVHEIDDPTHGKKKQAGPVAWLSSSVALAGEGDVAPKPDQHRNEILTGIADQVVETKPGGTMTNVTPFLKGVKILDMTNVIAGPTVAHTLGRFGAEVIKVYPTKPTFDPWNTVLIGLQVHQGKRSILADIKTEKGRGILKRLIEWADVLAFNGPERQLHELNIDPESLKAINPAIIPFYLDAWGGPKNGPRSDDVGYDDLVQASTGIMARFGGAINTPEEHAHLGTIDVLTGFAGAFAIATALYKHRKTGVPDVARTSLAAAGQMLQSPFTYDYENRPPFNEPSGRNIKGYGPFYRCYQAQDGWFFLATKEESVERFESVAELKGSSQKTPDELEKFLSNQFANRETAYWIEALTKIDIGAVELGAMAKLRERYLSSDEIAPHASGGTYQFTRYDNHPSGHRIDIISPCSVRPKYSNLTVTPPAEKYGRETKEILVELEFSDEEISQMLDLGVVSESWGEQYLPD
jgi:crotonobetainyl-CoA:carnitine CoA-transferase CaiB-like acyl-CoA transferase